MTEPYIQSVTINVPSHMVYGRPKYLKELFKAARWGNYFQYGYSSLILVDLRYFCPSCSVFDQIAPFFRFLQGNGVLSPFLDVGHITIHEIKLRFDIDVVGALFCKTGSFLKVDDVTYRSNDTRKLTRKSLMDDSKEWSKGRQMSFITVIQRDNGCSVIFSFSGKYRRHIPVNFLCLSNMELIQRLCSIGSVYLTQVSNPESFKISEGYKLMLPKQFQSMLNNANWNKDTIKRRNITSNFIGGALL
jgi:hypothetical protein